MSRSLLRLTSSLPTRTSCLLPTFRLSSSSSSSSKPDSDLTHPALLHDPPAVTPQDPWPLKQPPPPPAPGPAHLYPSMAELLASPHPEGRDNEPAETLRKRLVYESRKRGILEMDLILATFAKERLPGMTEDQLREYDRVRLGLGGGEGVCHWASGRAGGLTESDRTGVGVHLLTKCHTLLSCAVPDERGLDYLLLDDRQGQGARAVGVVVGAQRTSQPRPQQGQDSSHHARTREPRRLALLRSLLKHSSCIISPRFLSYPKNSLWPLFATKSSRRPRASLLRAARSPGRWGVVHEQEMPNIYVALLDRIARAMYKN